MPSQLITRAHTPAHLQGFAIGYKPRGLIAERLCPRFPVSKQSDKYRIWGKDLYQLRDGKRAPGAPPIEIRRTYASEQFFAENYSWRHPLLDEERVNADADLQLEIRYTEAATMADALAFEKRVADLYTTAANYTGSHAIVKGGGQEWNTVPANVITDLDALIQVIIDDASVPADMLTVVIPEIVYRTAIRNNTNYLERIKYSERGVTTPELLAQVHGVKEVILGSAQGVPMPEKVVSDIVEGYTTQYLWGDNVWVGLVGVANNDMEPSFSRCFAWEAATGGQSRQVRTYRDADEGTRKDWVEVASYTDEKITARLAGGVIRNTLSTI